MPKQDEPRNLVDVMFVTPKDGVGGRSDGWTEEPLGFVRLPSRGEYVSVHNKSYVITTVIHYPKHTHDKSNEEQPLEAEVYAVETSVVGPINVNALQKEGAV